MPPVLVAAGVTAAASVGGALLSSSAQKKAAKSAANSAQQTATQNNALQQQIYNANAGYLSPFVSRGNAAGNAINALLGIGGGTAQGTQQFGPAIPLGGGAGGPGQPPYTQDQIDAMWTDGIPGNAERAQARLNAWLAANPGYNPSAPAPTPATTAPADPQAYQNAFQNYLNSTGYQFQIDQGNKAINQGYAARGSLQSGAALKALQTYGQNTATGFFKDYLGLLSNQQGVGLSGASAIAGVGQNYANAANANNTAAGNAAANAALMAGNANANMYGSIAGAVGGLANVFGSSYGTPPFRGY